jgi:lactaldehyde reductase
LRPLLKDVGARRVLVIASARGLASDGGLALVGGLGRTVTVFAFDGAHPGVPAESVQAATRLAITEVVDTVISFGGGAAIDLAKAVVFFAEQQAGTPGVNFDDRPAVAHVAVPTTLTVAAGSPHFAMTAGRQMQVAESPTLQPRFVVWDPTVLAGLSAEQVAAAGMATLIHAVDAAVSPSRSPESEAVALAAFGRVYGALVPAVEGDGDAVAALQEGAALAARAWSGVSPGPAHGLAQLLAGRAGAPYAPALVALTPHLLRFNAEAYGNQLEQVARQILAEDLAEAVKSLAGEVGLSGGISDLAVTDEDADAVARLSQGNPFVQRSPSRLDEVTVRGLLDAAWV